MKFENVYWDARTMNDDHVLSPSILAIGDSWFWYPFPGGSLLNRLGRATAPKGHVILAIGNNGAEAYDYVKGKYRRDVRTALRFYGDGLSAVFVSGGGNDFAGLSDLRPMLKDRCGGETAAAGCFRTGDDEGTLQWLMGRVLENYGLLLWRIFERTPSLCKVFVHNYDFAVPDGRGVFGHAGWLAPALDAAGVPETLRQDVIRHIVAEFTKAMQQLRTGAPDRIVLVESAGTLDASGWANELHPTPAGFDRIAAAWKPRLAAAGLA